MVGLSFLAAVSWYCILSSKWLQSRHKMHVKLHFKCYKIVKITCSPLICVMRTDLVNLSTVWAVCCRISCLKQISWQQKYNTISNYNQFDSLRRYCPVVILQICKVSELQRFCRPRYDRITLILRVIGNCMNCACVDTKHSFLKSHVNLILAIKILFVIYTSVYILLLHIKKSFKMIRQLAPLDDGPPAHTISYMVSWQQW